MQATLKVMQDQITKKQYNNFNKFINRRSRKV